MSEDNDRSPPDDAILIHQTRIECSEGKHDFQGWREFEDGNGGEQVCAKCGIGAMQYSIWVGP